MLCEVLGEEGVDIFIKVNDEREFTEIFDV